LQRALSTIVLLGLLLASAAAFAITEHLKLIKSPIYGPQVTNVFSPVCRCATDKAVIKFKLRHPDTVTVSIVDSGRNVIATLPVRVDSPAKKRLTFTWNGHTSAGTVVPNGSVFQPQVHLSHGRYTILMPNKISVDTVPPKVLSATVGGDAILIVGGPAGLPIRYVLGERAHVSVYVGGRRVILGRRTRPSGRVRWNGKVGGKRLRPGRYVLEVAAVDLAGNETPPAGRKRVVVQIRYVALSGTPRRVAPGARFTVKVRTGAPRYTWRFAGTHGIEKKRLLHLRAPAHGGRYRLVVSTHGHATSAIVNVGKK
jgi:hypothetical protein